MAWFVIALAGICCLFLHRYLTNRHKAVIRWPIFGMLPALLLNIHQVLDGVTTVLRDSSCTFQFYGPILSGMDYVVTCDPRNIEYILKTNFENFPRGPEFREMFHDIFGDGILTADGDSWRFQRKLAHFHFRSKGFRDFVAKTTQEMVQNGLLPLLTKVAREGSVIDLQKLLSRFTFNNAFVAIFGESPGCLSLEFTDVPLAIAVRHVGAVFYRHVVPSFCWKLLRFLRVGNEGKLANARNRVKKLFRQRVINRPEGTDDLLSRYMASIEDSESSRSEDFLKDNMVNFLMGGRDTSSVGLTWFFWLTTRHSHVEAKIIEELKYVLGRRNNDGSLNKTEEIVFTVDELQELKYLHAALCETLRLYPPLPMDHRGVSHVDVLPNGTHVRPGMRIFYSIYSMARMEWIWGKDCLDFKPERWIDEHGRLKPEPAFKFMAFNAGPRTCVGKDMAFVQMKSVAAGILANFGLKVVDGHHACYKMSMVLGMKNGLMVRVSERSCILNNIMEKAI